MIHTGDHYEHLARTHRASEIRRVFGALFQLPGRLVLAPKATHRLSPSDTSFRAA
ncbi:hypothetical protein [uncultured Roseibium sp.]|uniref:hypothetical protein n=1 Tax=uncultured Roseibium sp. TaxID=1936171 RepID=UPI0032176437